MLTAELKNNTKTVAVEREGANLDFNGERGIYI